MYMMLFVVVDASVPECFIGVALLVEVGDWRCCVRECIRDPGVGE